MTNVSLSLYFMPIILARFTSQLPSLSEGCAPTNSVESRRFQSDSQRRGKDLLIMAAGGNSYTLRRVASSRVASRRVQSLNASIFIFVSRTPVTGVTAAICRSEMKVERLSLLVQGHQVVLTVNTETENTASLW